MQDSNCIKTPNCWGFQQENWHDDCVKKCVIRGELCAVILCITSELSLKICSDSLDAHSKGDCQTFVSEGKMGLVSRFCTYLLDRVIRENGFSWEDTMVGLLPSSIRCNSFDLILWRITIILLLVASIMPHLYIACAKEHLESLVLKCQCVRR